MELVNASFVHVHSRLTFFNTLSIQQGSFFGMMGIGFWWGGHLTIQSREQAMINNPIPADFETNDQGELAHRLLLLFSSVRAKNGTQWGH